VPDLDGENLPIAKFGNCFEHLGCLLLKPEVRKGGFAARAVLPAELYLPDYPRGRGEGGFASAYPEILDPAEIELLHQFDETALGLR
jgi:hypothetical protein